MTRPTPTRGVTLIELLTVIVMIGILAGMAASRLDWRRYRADAAGRRVLAELAGAQRTAVSLQVDIHVLIPSPDRMVIHEDADNDGTIDAGERVRGVAMEDGYRLAQAGAAAVPAPSDAAELTAVTFRRNGAATRAGTVYVTPPGAGTGCHLCRAVAVARSTGRAVLYSHGSGTWKQVN